jgi:ankyrin repeat protein
MPLHIACWQKQLGIIGVLAAHQPDVNARGCYGRTPLHYAVHEGGPLSVPIVADLLARGADPSIRDDNGFTVEDWAKVEMDEGLPDVLALLRGKRP